MSCKENKNVNQGKKKVKNEWKKEASFINGSFIDAERHSICLFVINCNLPRRTQAAITGYSSKCALDWISAGNENNLSPRHAQSMQPLPNRKWAGINEEFKGSYSLRIVTADKGEATSAAT